MSNELTELNKQYRVDTVLDFEEFIVNMEFFSTPLKNKDILKCLIYSVLLHKREEKPTMTIIICTAGKYQNITLPYYYSTIDNFNPIIIDNSKINGWEELNKIKQKIKNNKQLNHKDITTLGIITTFNSNKSKEKLIIEARKVLKEANIDTEEKIKIENVQFVLSDKFIKDKKVLKQIWSENMEIGVLDYVKKEGIEEGIEKGMEKGSNKKAYNVAKKLLEDNIPIEKIAYYSGLKIDEIKSLKNSK